MTLGDKIFNWVKAQNTNDCYPTMSDIQSHFAPRNIYENVVGMEQSYRAHALYLKNNRNHKKGDARLYLFYDKNKNDYVAY